MSVRRIVPNLRTDDLAEGRDFFVAIFGFSIVMDMQSILTLASATNATAQITLQHGVDPGLTIEVDDVDDVYSAASERHAEIVYPLTDESWGVRRFFLRGPGGMVINVMMHTR